MQVRKWLYVLLVAVLSLAEIAEGRERRPVKSEPVSLKDLVTIITSTHPTPGIPSTTLLEVTQKSLYMMPELRDCRKIIVFDGINSDLGYFSRRLNPKELEGRDIHNIVFERYEAFKNNVLQLTQTSPYFSNTELLFCKEHLNLAFGIKEALLKVTTPYVLIHQHDIEIIKKIDAVNIIRSMQANPNIKLVRLNVLGNQQNDWDSILDKHIEGGAFVPLLRTNLWSDQDHFTSVGYYLDFILPKLPPKSCMEWFLMAEEKREIEKDIRNHLIYGTYVYGTYDETPYLRHHDGSRSYGTKWDY